MRGFVSSTKSATRDGATRPAAAAGATSMRRPSSPIGRADRHDVARGGARAASDATREARASTPSSSAPVATCAVVTSDVLARQHRQRRRGRSGRRRARASPSGRLREPRPAGAEGPHDAGRDAARRRRARPRGARSGSRPGRTSSGGTTRPSASGKSGIASPAFVCRMTAPTRSCRKTAPAVAAAIRATGLRRRRRDARRRASFQRGEVTTAIVDGEAEERLRQARVRDGDRPSAGGRAPSARRARPARRRRASAQ